MGKLYDKVFINAKFFTSQEQQLYGDALAVKDGKVAWIGKQENRSFAEETCIDLEGKRVLPGFIDNHIHPLFLADTLEQIACLPPNVSSAAELLEKVRQKAQKTPKGEWIVGWGYDEGKFPEKRVPLRKELDEAAPEHPVVLVRTCFHIASVNSKTLEILEYTKDLPDPPGGEMGRYEDGELNGILKETARFKLMDIMPKKSPEEMAKTMVELGHLLLSHGITGIVESGGEMHPVDCYDIFQRAAQLGMKQRMAIYYFWDELKNNPKPVPQDKKDNTKQIFVGGIKIIGDGSVSGRTAWCDENYLGSDSCGFPVANQEDILAAGRYAKENQIQLKYHAMGAKAIARAVDTYDQEESWMKDRPSVRIEHSAMPTEESMERCGKSGIAMTVQPIFLYCEIESYLANLGSERTKKLYPTRTMLDKGVLTAFSSDAPATSWADPSNPFVGIQGAVTRIAYDGTPTGADQRVDVETAIQLYTRESQKVTGIARVGKLAEGYHADFVVLDRDILEIPPEEIGQIQVIATYMGGEEVYGRARKKTE